MMRFRLGLLVGLIGTVGIGQNRIIRGQVIDEELQALPMAQIYTTDTLLLGETDMAGKFEISIPHNTKNLLFGFVGYEWSNIALANNCPTVEIIMLQQGLYHYKSTAKVDRIRRRRFDKIPEHHSDAVKKGIFKNNNLCYKMTFKPEKPSLDKIKKWLKTERRKNKEMYNALSIGDTIIIPYPVSRGDDGTDRTTLHLYSFTADRKKYDCIIKGVIIDKPKRRGGYKIVYKIIDLTECSFNNIVLNGMEISGGENMEYDMKYFKVLRKK